jgi:hypothetical protein
MSRAFLTFGGGDLDELMAFCQRESGFQHLKQ